MRLEMQKFKWFPWAALLAVACAGDRAPVDEGAWVASWCPPESAEFSPVHVTPLPLQSMEWGELMESGAFPGGASVAFLPADDRERAMMDEFIAFSGIPEGTSEEAPIFLQVLPFEAWDEAATECGHPKPSSGEAYILSVQPTTDGNVAIRLVAPNESGLRMAFLTAAQVVRAMVESPEATRRRMLFLDAPAIDGRGVIETFYGAPYLEEERRALLPWLGRLKFNQYIYAAKMDVWVNWIGPYWSEDFNSFDAGYVAFLERLCADIKASGMVPGIQVRPLDQLVFSSSEDVARFVDKVAFFQSLGFEIFSLSFDDTDKILYSQDQAAFESYDDAVTAFSASAFDAIRARMPDLKLGWVPNDYYTNDPDAASQLPLAGQRLPQYVSIGWTGNEVIPAAITADDAARVAAWLRRKPLLGDNYPVWEPTATRYFLGPLVGRSADLAGALDSIMFNPNPAPFPSLPALVTCADYAWNPTGYQPEAAIDRMAAFLAGKSPAATALVILARHNRSHLFHGSMAPELAPLLSQFWVDFSDGNATLNSSAVKTIFSDLAGLPSSWSVAHLPEPLFLSLESFVNQAGRMGVAGMDAVNLLSSIAAGLEPEPSIIESFNQTMAEIADHPEEPSGDVIVGFLEQASMAINVSN